MIEEQRLKELFIEVLEDRARVDSVTHAKHHQFIEELIQERQEKRERAEKIKTHVIGWGVVTGISGLGYGLYTLVKTWLSTQVGK